MCRVRLRQTPACSAWCCQVRHTSEQPFLEWATERTNQGERQCEEQCHDGECHVQRRWQVRGLIPQGVRDRASDEHIQELAHRHAKQEFVLNVEVCWDFVLVVAHVR